MPRPLFLAKVSKSRKFTVITVVSIAPIFLLSFFLIAALNTISPFLTSLNRMVVQSVLIALFKTRLAVYSFSQNFHISSGVKQFSLLRSSTTDSPAALMVMHLLPCGIVLLPISDLLGSLAALRMLLFRADFAKLSLTLLLLKASSSDTVQIAKLFAYSQRMVVLFSLLMSFSMRSFFLASTPVVSRQPL